MKENEKKLTLDQVPVGQECFMESMDLNGVMRRRLQDLGLIPGTKVVPERKSPGNGPTAYRLRESVYALRQEDSCRIYVTEKI